MNIFPTKNNQQNRSNQDDIRRTSLLQWGIAVGLLMVVIFVMVVNFCVSSRNHAFYGIKEEMLTESELYATEISHELEMTFQAANAVAGIMSDKDKSSNENVAWYAQKLQRTQDGIYMVIIADNNGHGYTSGVKRVDISGLDYFQHSGEMQYYVTEDDGVLHERAYVMMVPYYQEQLHAGTIYMFMSASDIADIIPTGAYDLAASFAICDSEGEVLASAGAKTKFLENGEFVSNLQKAKFQDEDNNASRVLSRLENSAKFTFTAEYNGQTKYFVCVPLGVSDWQYVTIINQSYVDRLIANDWINAKTMTIELAIVAVIFIVMVVVIAVMNRMHYNERNKELATKADTDQLTGLNNKMATERKIQEYIEQNPDKQCLFFLFDIDNFKKINDTLGHAFGDEVLRSLGHQLSNEFRVTDIIGRIGGDEFVLFLKDMGSEEILEKEAARFARFFKSFQAGEYVKYSATSSIGATVYPRDAKSYQALYKTADIALYEAKRQGKNRMVFYNKDLKEVDPDKKKSTPIDSDMR